MRRIFSFPLYSFFSNTYKIGQLYIITDFNNFNKFWFKFSFFYFLNETNRLKKSKIKQNLSYSNKKLRRQKYLGKARLGTQKSPLLRGGKKSFGPSNIKIENKINTKLIHSNFNELLILFSYKLIVIKLPKLKCYFKVLLEFLKYNFKLINKKDKIYFVFPFSNFNVTEKNINYSSYSNLNLTKLLLTEKIILFV